MKEIIPIFSLGVARSGTTWLGNILCEHPEIIGAQHELHWGIHESHIYSNKMYWRDFSDKNNYIKFLEHYSSADYFNIIKGDKEYFYSNPQESFYHFYLELM